MAPLLLSDDRCTVIGLVCPDQWKRNLLHLIAVEELLISITGLRNAIQKKIKITCLDQ